MFKLIKIKLNQQELKISPETGLKHTHIDSVIFK